MPLLKKTMHSLRINAGSSITGFMKYLVVDCYILVSCFGLCCVMCCTFRGTEF
jgi:hypothetical protein